MGERKRRCEKAARSDRFSCGRPAATRKGDAIEWGVEWAFRPRPDVFRCGDAPTCVDPRRFGGANTNARCRCAPLTRHGSLLVLAHLLRPPPHVAARATLLLPSQCCSGRTTAPLAFRAGTFSFFGAFAALLPPTAFCLLRLGARPARLHAQSSKERLDLRPRRALAACPEQRETPRGATGRLGRGGAERRRFGKKGNALKSQKLEKRPTCRRRSRQCR